MLGPGAVGTHLADLGAEVIKVEPPAGDYIRQMTWPIIEGSSLLHWHIGRGKRSITLDLRTDEGQDVFKELVGGPTWSSRRCGPGPRPPWPGFRGPKGSIRRSSSARSRATARPVPTPTCRPMASPTTPGPGSSRRSTTRTASRSCRSTPRSASTPVPLFAALGILAGVIRARDTGEPAFLDIAQSDAAAAMDWYRSETWKAYERPESEVTGNKSDNYERRAPGTAGMQEGVRYQIYESSDGHILFMASEQEFWRTSARVSTAWTCSSGGPGNQYGDHAAGQHRAAPGAGEDLRHEDHCRVGGPGRASTTRRSLR